MESFLSHPFGKGAELGFPLESFLPPYPLLNLDMEMKIMCTLKSRRQNSEAVLIIELLTVMVGALLRYFSSSQQPLVRIGP